MLQETTKYLEKIEKIDKIELGGYSQGMLDLKGALYKMESKLPTGPVKNTLNSFRTEDFQKANDVLSKFKK